MEKDLEDKNTNENNVKDIETKLIELGDSLKNKQQLEFEWNQKNGLRYVSDESLELVYEILVNVKLSLSLKEDKVIISNNMVSLCNYKYTTEDLIEQIRKDKKQLILDKLATYTVEKDLTVNRVCLDCKFQRCPKHIAGYILYLINKNQLKEKLEDRKKYREQTENFNDKFAFEWKFGDILRIIPEEMYRFSQEIVDKGYIHVDRSLTNNEKNVKIYSPLLCDDLKIMYGNVNAIKSDNKDKKTWLYLVRSANKEIQLCNSYSCKLPGCALAIAGILYYLKEIGRQDIIESERQYYLEHQEEMDKKLDNIIQERNIKIRENTDRSLENVKKYKSKIDKFDELIYALENTNQENLHCTIEGDDYVEKAKLIQNISRFLFNAGKLREETYEKISLYNLAAKCAYDYSEEIQKNDVDRFGVPYRLQNGIKYTVLKEKKLYVINNIAEFIHDFKILDNRYNMMKNKQMHHVLDLLAETACSNYIILDGTTKEIDAFLKLDPKLQYIYQNYRFKFHEFDLDEAFKLYLKSLDNNIFSKIKNKEYEYKKQFMEYISLNKNFIPFSNRELASYLAMYSNSKGDAVLPENIYKKETVDEALKNIVGLDVVKEKVKEFEKYMLFKVKAESEGLKLENSNMHMIFTGNPGTGKTTIARIMAKMLFDMGIIQENKLLEVERKDLVAGYIGQTAQKTSEVIQNAMGGVLFIDEAYSLANGSKNDFGIEAIATLIKAMEDHKDKLVVIFAGYKDEMKDFLDINPGISSRIGYTFDFPDYNTDELVEIFYKKIKRMGFECAKRCDLEIKKICAYFSQRKSFGNGRFVDKLVQETILKHAINENPVNKIEIDDIPSISDINNSPDNEETTDELLENIVGLKELKEKIKEFENYVKFIKKAEKKNINIPNQNMHMIFVGNPGTGKTTIARIMAKILYNTGIIQENKLVEVERKDLIGDNIGQTAPKTAEIIKEALGGVLFIDEAYTLATKSQNDFGAEAVATLIKAMEDHKGELVVIYAGYKDEMKKFLDINPGISSRIGYTFDFPDYNTDELIQIYHSKIKKMGFECNEECNTELKKICTYFSQRKAFGNGRFVDKLIQETILKHAKNNKSIDKIDVEDIPTIREFNNSTDPEETTEELLEKIIGLKDLKEKIKEFENYVKFIKEAEKKNINLPNQNMHMIFTGNPGTGKTTIARIMAKILYNAGIIQENKLIEVERKDLIGEYIGQTAPKTAEVIEKALGGILFIDEAYSLANETKQDYGGEAIATLIKAMEDHKGEFIVIFAGYKKEMGEFLNMNSGIASRIGYIFDFPDYTREELCEILYKKLEKSNLKIEENAKKKVFEIMNYFCNVENIGNGRFADKVLQSIILKHAENASKDVEIIVENDIPTIKEMTNSLFNGEYMINPDEIPKEALKKTAIHEIGHALVRYKLYKTPGVITITINPEGAGTLGYVKHKNVAGEYVRTKSSLLNQIKVSLAGMAAEEIFCGEFANGNTSDLEKATAIARNMITRYGMSKIGFGQIKNLEGEMAVKVQEEINSILSDCYRETCDIITKNKEQMTKVVDYLLEQKEISEEEFVNVFNNN